MQFLFRAITERLDAILIEQRAIRRAVSRIENQLKRWSLQPPGPVTEVLLRETDSMLIYKAAFPALPNPIGDIEQQKFTVTVGGEVKVEETFGTDVLESNEFSVEEGDEVTLTMVYVDDAGNESTPSTQTFTAHDSLPPSAPGAFQEVTLLREE